MPNKIIGSVPQTGARRNMTPAEVEALWAQGQQGLQPTLAPMSLTDLVMEPVGALIGEADIGQYLLPLGLLGMVKAGKGRPRGKTLSDLVPAVYTKDLPPPKSGHVRVFRGEHPTAHDPDVFNPFPGEVADKGVGGWFTTDEKLADYYRSSQSPGAHIVYMDVPRSALDRYQAGKQFPAQASRFGPEELFFPELRQQPKGSTLSDLTKRKK